MDLKLTGQRALITGGSKGIGRATAEVLADEGVDVVLVARDSAALDEAATALRARRQVNVATIAADLSREEEVLRVADAAGPKSDLLGYGCRRNSAGRGWRWTWVTQPGGGPGT